MTLDPGSIVLGVIVILALVCWGGAEVFWRHAHARAVFWSAHLVQHRAYFARVHADHLHIIDALIAAQSPEDAALLRRSAALLMDEIGVWLDQERRLLDSEK